MMGRWQSLRHHGSASVDDTEHTNRRFGGDQWKLRQTVKNVLAFVESKNGISDRGTPQLAN